MLLVVETGGMESIAANIALVAVAASNYLMHYKLFDPL
jgi:hypothetical protein